MRGAFNRGRRCSAVIPDGPAAAPRNDRKFLENCFSSNSKRRLGQNLSRSSGIWCLGTAGLRCSWWNVCSLPGANASPSNACLPATILPFAPELQLSLHIVPHHHFAPVVFFWSAFALCSAQVRPSSITCDRRDNLSFAMSPPRCLWSNILGNNINSFHPLSWRTLSDRSNPTHVLSNTTCIASSIRAQAKSRHCFHH